MEEKPIPIVPVNPGQGGIPQGKRSDELPPDHVGGRHSGGLLQDPETTLEKLDRPKLPPRNRA